VIRTPPRPPAADAALLGVAAVWGVSYLTVKTLATTVPVGALLLTRFALSTLLFGLLWAAWPTRSHRDEVTVGFTLGLLQAACIALEAVGVTHTSAAHGGLIISLALLLTPFFEGHLRQRHLPVAFYAFLIVVLVGLACLIGSRGLSQPNGGDALFLGAAIIRSGYMAWLGAKSHTVPLRPIPLNTIAFAVSTLCLTVVTPTSFSVVGHLPGAAWVGLLYLAAVSTVLAFFVQAWAIARTSAARVGLLMGTEPLWAVLAGVLVGHESLGPAGLLGAALIVLGTYGAQRFESDFRRRTHGPPLRHGRAKGPGDNRQGPS
jgi:drug/metabolite transporter (DMT)-like permease